MNGDAVPISRGWTLRTLQDEQRPWVAHNFGDRPSWQPLLGLAEEMGELFDAIRDQAGEDALKDAMADIMIFAADFCSAHGFDLDVIFERVREQPSQRVRPMASDFGRLAHAYLKKAQGIRGTPEEHDAAMLDALEGFLAHVHRAASQRNWDLVLITRDVWESVRRRDWRANAQTGAAQ